MKVKRTLLILASLIIVSVFGTVAYAEEGSSFQNNPIEVIEKYVNAMNEQRWDDFADLHSSEQKESLNGFFANEQNEICNNGVLNVRSAELIEVVEVKYDDVDDMLYESYDTSNDKVYVFGVDYSVEKDTKYYSSGINYNIITLVQENNKWKVKEMVAISEPQRLIDLGYEFSDNYLVTISVIKARYDGLLMNYEGEVFDTLFKSEPINNEISTRAIINTRTVPTSTTKVRYKNASGTITSINFHDYCLGVTAGEVRSTTFDGEARKASVLAIKTFTWHYIILPHGATEGYDLNSSQQAYVPDKVSENSKVTTDYNTVKSVWMESAGGAIFIAYYKAGTYANQSSYKNGGELKQNGSRWLLDNDSSITNCYKVLHYYYDSSTASTGGAIKFFNDSKTELYY